MKRLLYFISLLLLLSSCYPSYSIQSAKVLEKGTVSGHVGAFVPIINPSFGVRYGLGNQNEISFKSSIICNEIGFKRALIYDDSNFFQIATGLTFGNGFIQMPTGEFEYQDNVMWGDSSLVEKYKSVGLPLVTVPLYFSLHNAADNVRLYGRLAPTWSQYQQKPSFGFMSNLGIAFGRKTTFCIEAFLHAPLNDKENVYEDLFGYKEVESLSLYNLGVMLGVVLGEF
jgi:hypothetical protein